MEKIRVVQFGLGPIGIESARQVLQHPKLELVGAVDVDPQKVGKDVGELFESPQKTGIPVSGDAEKLLAEQKPSVVLHTTQSFVKVVFPQLETIIKSGANIVSSTEELLFPRLKNPDLAEKLDALAREHGVTVLGTGVNPGFVMDTLPLVSTAVCADVKKIRVERYVNAAYRRLPLQKKVGAGLTVEEFKKRVAAGTMGHIGMKESVALIAYGLGWQLDEIKETTDPMVADRDYQTKFLEVKKGQAAGIKNIGRGYRNGEEVITLDLRMYVGCPNPHDSVHLESDPPIDLVIENGVFGDLATVAMLINSIPNVLNAEPGVKTMVDLPIPRYFSKL